jgi:serine protease Do
MRLILAMSMAILAAGAIAPAARAQGSTRAYVGPAIARSSYLGIGAQDIDSERAKTLKLKEVRGAEVTSVATDSPAAKAGIKDGDVILEFNGQPVEGTDQLARMVKETPVGRQVKLGIWRAGAAQSVTATMEAGKGFAVFSGDAAPFPMPMPKLQELPSIEIPRFQMMNQNPMLGIFGESMGNQEQLAEFFGVKEGVLVKSVNKGSAAERAGIKAGDVIVKIEETHVNTTSEITSALRAARSKSSTSVNITVVRGKKEMPLTVTVDVMPARTVKAGMIMIERGGGVKLVPLKVLQLAPQHRVI